MITVFLITEAKLDATTGVHSRLQELETLVSEYAGKINALDSNLTSQVRASFIPK